VLFSGLKDAFWQLWVPVLGQQVVLTRIVRGDALSLSIAAASILAKTERDARMRDYDGIYPAYGFAQHKGYPVKQHLLALEQHGPCPIHRRSFAPVQQAALLHGISIPAHRAASPVVPTE
jgi:ribonuclease HII